MIKFSRQVLQRKEIQTLLSYCLINHIKELMSLMGNAEHFTLSFAIFLFNYFGGLIANVGKCRHQNSRVIRTIVIGVFYYGIVHILRNANFGHFRSLLLSLNPSTPHST